jgi:CDP-diacylglycerol---serine O-phosphatidyltransferase
VIERPARGIPFRAMVPNAVTALALCFGLTGVRFAISASQGEPEHWQLALACVVGAGVLDGLDGRVARLLRAESKFGAELDSLSDNIAFGTAPALILFLWSLQHAPKFGWTAALALAVCCALRLARFNARIDASDQPHKSAGFNTGVPAPAGAGLAFLPILLWLVSGSEWFRTWYVVMPWVLFVALLMISSIPTYSWTSVRIRSGWRLFALAGIALVGAALLTAPWHTLLAITALYLLMIPFSFASYARVRQRRATAHVRGQAAGTGRANGPGSAPVEPTRAIRP